MTNGTTISVLGATYSSTQDARRLTDELTDAVWEITPASAAGIQALRDVFGDWMTEEDAAGILTVVLTVADATRKAMELTRLMVAVRELA